LPRPPLLPPLSAAPALDIRMMLEWGVTTLEARTVAWELTLLSPSSLLLLLAKKKTDAANARSSSPPTFRCGGAATNNDGIVVLFLVPTDRVFTGRSACFHGGRTRWAMVEIGRCMCKLPDVRVHVQTALVGGVFKLFRESYNDPRGSFSSSFQQTK
jgi:hypothetical protein